MEKKERCVVFGITSNLTFAVANIIIAIETYTPNFINEYIIYFNNQDPIKNYEIEVLRKICSRIRFIPILSNENLIKNPQYLKRYSVLNCSAKLSIFRHLNDYHKVLFLDADLLIQGSIESLFNYSPIAWRKTVIPFNKVISVWEKKKINESYTAPNGGVVLVTDELKNYKELYEQAMIILRQIANISFNDMMGYDELVFAILNFKFNLGAKELPKEFNAGTGWKNSQKAVIVHSIGEKKFWNDALRYIIFPQWAQFHEQYLELGGQNGQFRFKHEKDIGTDAKGIISAFNNYDYWEKLTRNLSVSNDIIQSHNYFRKYIQFYIKNVEKTTHYELIKISNNRILVALHCEKKSLDYVKSNPSFVNEIKNLGNAIGFESKLSETCFMIYKEVDAKRSVGCLHKLIAKTVNYLILKRSKKLGSLDKINRYIKFLYRKYIK